MAKITLTKTITTDYSCTISTEELLKILNKRSVLSRTFPPDTKVTITVPSGGDYSGDTLDLDDIGGLCLTWREVQQA